MKNKALTLSELNNRIKQSIEDNFLFPIWVVAEISEISDRQHCYLELVQKDKVTARIIAKNRATIWSYTYNVLKSYFETTTGYELAVGMKILVSVTLQYSELYGLSLNIKDIDPNYTVGDMERHRRETLQRLEEEGILEMNKDVSFPNLPKTIAIISSEKAAGYQDFMKQLHQNNESYKFHTHLFPALMQGEQASSSIRKALEKIYTEETVFDLVVIIRGGGAASDLACFDEYELAAHIAQFPLAVLTGIGHDKDVSIADEVAHLSFKTPTAVADYLVYCFQQCEEIVLTHYKQLSYLTRQHLEEQKEKLNNYRQTLKYSLPQQLKSFQLNSEKLALRLQRVASKRVALSKREILSRQQQLRYLFFNKQKLHTQNIAYMQQKVKHRTIAYLENKKDTLAYQERLVVLLSPQKLLERGYSITTYKGKILKDATTLLKGETIETQVAKGKFISKVEN